MIRTLSFGMRVSFALTLLLTSVPSQALEIYPNRHVLEVKKGKSMKGEFRLTNTDPIDITVYPGSYRWTGTKTNSDYEVDEWLTVDPSSFTMKQGDTRFIPFTVYAPKKVKGELAAMVSFLTRSPQRTSVNFKISAAVYMLVEGTDEYRTEIKDVAFRQDRGKLEVGLLVDNTGNVHIRPGGLFEVFNEFGKVKANVKINISSPVHPMKKSQFYGETTTLLEPGKYYTRYDYVDVDRNEKFTPYMATLSVKKNGKIKVKPGPYEFKKRKKRR